MFFQPPDISRSSKIAGKPAILNGLIIPEGNEFLDSARKTLSVSKTLDNHVGA
jgi:hypothetical protein